MIPILKRGLPHLILLFATALLVVDNVDAATSRFDAQKLKRAESALRKEPKIIDLTVEPNYRSGVEWQIGVRNDGTNRSGYARYVCLKLREFGVYDDDVDVRIVDFPKVMQNGGDFRAASLGHVRCKDEAVITP